MHAATANRETCAWKQCCQPATTNVNHNGVEIGYCRRHAIRVLGYDPKVVNRC